MAICSKCNRNIESNYSFCPYCGGSVIQQSSSSQNQYSSNVNNGNFNQNPIHDASISYQNINSDEHNTLNQQYYDKSKKNLIIVLIAILIVVIIAATAVFIMNDKDTTTTGDSSLYNNENSLSYEDEQSEDSISTKKAEKYSNTDSKEKKKIGDVIVEKSKEKIFSTGKVTGSQYKNEYFGIGCTLSGWKYSKQEDMLCEVEGIKDLLSSKATNNEIAKALEKTDIYMDMQSTGTGATNVNIMVERIEGKNIGSNEKNILNAMKTAAEQQYSAMGIDLKESEIIECSFDGSDKYAVHSVFTYSGAELEAYQLVFIEKTHAATLTVTSDNVNEIEEVLENFYYLD